MVVVADALGLGKRQVAFIRWLQIEKAPRPTRDY